MSFTLQLQSVCTLALFMLCMNTIQAQKKYKYREEYFYNDYDTGVMHQIFNEYGKMIFEENVGWSRKWCTYQDSLLIGELKIEQADSMNTKTKARFTKFYTDTTVTKYSNSFDMEGKIVLRKATIRKFTAKHPMTDMQFIDETFDYTREWKHFSEVTQYTYDIAGRITSEHTEYTTKTWMYDSLGRLIEERNPLLRKYEYTDYGMITKYIFRAGDTLVFNSYLSHHWDKYGKIILQTKIDRRADSDICNEERIIYEYGEEYLIEKIESIYDRDNSESIQVTRILHTNKKPEWAESALTEELKLINAHEKPKE